MTDEMRFTLQSFACVLPSELSVEDVGHPANTEDFEHNEAGRTEILGEYTGLCELLTTYF